MITSMRMALLPYVFIFYVVFFEETSALQQFDKTPSYTEVNTNEDVKLNCVILNKVGNCIWQKNRKPLAMYKGKYELAGNEEKGDCSILIRKALAEMDEGEWECQVTQSDINAQDSLSSPSVRLVVRAQPREPRIENDGNYVLPQQNVTVKSAEEAVLKCTSRYGNPPARLRWFLEDKEIEAFSNQTDTREQDNNRTFLAESTLRLPVNKSHHGKTIKCTAFHESYDTKSRSVYVKLNITYPPDVTLIGAPRHDIEEGKDTVTLQCIADANPPASIIWQRSGTRDIAGISETLVFKPVNQRDSGTYTCTAKNSVGNSQPIPTVLDVKYAPIIQNVGPGKVTSVSLYSSTDFTCSADGNPPPQYQWVQRVPNAQGMTEVVSVRSTDPKMHLTNVTYEHQGEYVCVVSNTIGGSERSVLSQPISLNVLGAPLIMTQLSDHEVVAHRGQDVLLRVIVCADPRPRRAAWEWGSMSLEAGSGIGDIRADELLGYHQEDCYEARFHLNRVEHANARKYHLVVENERGIDKHEVLVTVRGSYTEPLGMSAVFTVAIGSLFMFLLCVLLVVYAIKSHRCCFRRRRRGDFKPKDTESCNNDNEKSEINSSNGVKPPKIEAMMDNGLNDMLYCTSPSRRPPPPHTISAASPDAMKKKRRAIYESAICVPDNLRPPSKVSKSRCSAIMSIGGNSSRVSTFCGEFSSNESATQRGSRYRKKSGGSSSSKCSAKKRNTFSELQIPTVSDNGATRNRMACYNRQIIVHSDMQSYSMTEDRLADEYFCPQMAKAQTTNYDAYDYDDQLSCYDHEDLRTFRHGNGGGSMGPGGGLGGGYAEKDVI